MSTIIPTYNRAGLVCEAVASVQRQTYPDVEIIVVDDGSTDDTQFRLRAFGGSIRVIAQSNAGPSAARNRGIEAAQGSIIAFLDSDDLWHPTKLARQIALLQRAGQSVPCCLCNAAVVDPDGHITSAFEYAALTPSYDEGVWENVTEVLTTRFVMFTQMVAIRRNVLERVGGFDETLWFMEDYDLALRLSLEGPWGYIREPLVTYRQGSPESLAAAADTDARRLVESSLKARQSLFQRVATTEKYKYLRGPARRGLQMLRREHRGIQLSQHAGWPHAMLGRGVLRLNRYYRAVSRRSPWYPKMKVSTVS